MKRWNASNVSSFFADGKQILIFALQKEWRLMDLTHPQIHQLRSQVGFAWPADGWN